MGCETAAKAWAGAVSKLLVKEWQFAISNDLILVRVKSDISAIVNSIIVTESSGKCWIVFIYMAGGFFFCPFLEMLSMIQLQSLHDC